MGRERGAGGGLCGSRALGPSPFSRSLDTQKKRAVRAAGCGVAEPSLRRARFRSAPFPRDAAAPRAPAPPAPASPAPPARSSPKPRSRRRRHSRGEARAARDLGLLLRTREAAVPGTGAGMEGGAWLRDGVRPGRAGGGAGDNGGGGGAGARRGRSRGSGDRQEGVRERGVPGGVVERGTQGLWGYRRKGSREVGWRRCAGTAGIGMGT